MQIFTGVAVYWLGFIPVLVSLYLIKRGIFN